MPARASALLAHILLAASAPSAALAQAAAGLAGEIVRVTPVEGRQVVGTATVIVDGSLDVTMGRRNTGRTFRLAEIRTLERRVSQDSDVGRGALWGAGLGLVGGVVLGGDLVDGICSNQSCNEVGYVVALAGAGAAGGALVGMVLGALTSTTLWEVVPLDGLSGSLGVGISARRGLALSGRLPIARRPRS